MSNINPNPRFVPTPGFSMAASAHFPYTTHRTMAAILTGERMKAARAHEYQRRKAREAELDLSEEQDDRAAMRRCSDDLLAALRRA